MEGRREGNEGGEMTKFVSSLFLFFLTAVPGCRLDSGCVVWIERLFRRIGGAEQDERHQIGVFAISGFSNRIHSLKFCSQGGQLCRVWGRDALVLGGTLCLSICLSVCVCVCVCKWGELEEEHLRIFT